MFSTNNDENQPIDNNQDIASLRVFELMTQLNSEYQQPNDRYNLSSYSRMSFAWDRLRQICIDYQVIPPTATEFMEANYELIIRHNDLFEQLKNDLGYFSERAPHVLKMPDGRLIDLAAGCFIT